MSRSITIDEQELAMIRLALLTRGRYLDDPNTEARDGAGAEYRALEVKLHEVACGSKLEVARS